MTTPGWHPDPSGKHQHRFWDGTKWTEQVADGGVAANDPIASPPPVEAQSATPPPTQGKRSAPMVIGLGVLVVLVVGGGLLLITRDGGSGGGAGEFTLEVTSDRITAHEIQAKAGDHIALHIDDTNRINAVLGIDRGSYLDLHDVEHQEGWASNMISYLLSDSSDAFSEYADPVDDLDRFPELPGYPGVPITLGLSKSLGAGDAAIDGSRPTEGLVFIAPVDGTYAILFTSDGAPRDVRFTVEVARPDRVPEDFGTDDLTDFYSDDFYSDIVEDYASEHDLSDSYEDQFSSVGEVVSEN